MKWSLYAESPISIEDLKIGTSSNSYGFYSITVPIGKEIDIRFSSVGFKSHNQKLMLLKDTILNINMTAFVKELDELVITPDNESLSKGAGHIQLPLAAVKHSPTLLGEKDILKTIQLLPGVQRGTEGSVALYVRGGSPDQNLIILDDAQVYNANHLFGFFSVFNGDALKNVEFWKAGFPARYGGRISSIIDIHMKDGSKEKIKGEGGVGIISSRLTIEGPIKKNKSSFLISTRRSYLDLLTKPFMSESQKFSYRFYDVNAKMNFDINDKNKLLISGYFGNDKLNNVEKEVRTQSTLRSETGLGWGNSTLTLRWNQFINRKLFNNTTLLFSHFNFYLSDKIERTGSRPRIELTDYKSLIQDYSIKNDLDYFINNNHHIQAGFLLTNHIYRPKAFTQQDQVLNEVNSSFQKYINQEIGIYAEDSWQPYSNKKINLRYGLRINALNTSYKLFRYIEPRLYGSYEIINNLKLTGSYMRANQFVHLLSNTGIGLSTDLWVPATLKAPPQQSDQFSIGLIRDFSKEGFSISLESYRKYLRNIITYSEGASFLVISESADNIDWEDNITIGKGESYGTEILVQKSNGKLTGWVGYTLNWIVHQFDSLNNGRRFFPKYDSRHSITSTFSYKLNSKVTLSLNWVYNTGNALTTPHAYYFTNVTNFSQNIYQTSTVPYFGSRNSFRAEPYHRLDIAVQFYKKKKKYERFWEFGLFNAYNRKNPFYYYLQTKNAPGQNGQLVELKKKSLFPIIPSVSYNFKF